VDVAEFDYELPPERIAQAPAESRDASRLLVVDRGAPSFGDGVFGELPQLLRAGDCLVVNDSRVIPARVPAEDLDGRPVELLFVTPAEGATISAELIERIRRALRAELSPRHVPDEIREVPGIPRTLSGKKLEVPVRKILLGTPIEQAANPDAMVNPEVLSHFAPPQTA